MSGHSKWNNIKHVKAKNDAVTGKIFTKIGREIAVAVKDGGADPNSNAKLRSIMAKAKSAGMPNDNVSRSIKKASGELGSINYEPISYEGYGIGGAAVIIEALTDNKNRTAGEVRHIFDKFGGSLGSTNCVSYLFTKRGVFYIEKGTGITDDDMMMHCLEAGAEDCEINDTYFAVYSTPENFEKVKAYFEQNNITLANAEIDLIPANYIDLPTDKINMFLKMLDYFEDNDDVQEVYHNVNIPEEE